MRSSDLVELIYFINNHHPASNLNFDSKITDLLSLAIRNDDSNTFDRIMKYNFDINATTSHGYTLIRIASSHCKIEFVIKLLQKNVDISFDTERQMSALSGCFSSEMTDVNVKCAELLIRAGSDIEHLKDINNAGYHLSKLIKQKIDSESATPNPNPNPNSNSTDKKVIRIITFNQSIKFETKFISDACFVYMVDNVRKLITTSVNMQIEIPVCGEKIIGHLLPEGTIIGSVPLTKPMLCKFAFVTTCSDNKLDSWESIYL